MTAVPIENPTKFASQNPKAKSMCARLAVRIGAITCGDNCDYQPNPSLSVSTSCPICANKPSRIGAIMFMELLLRQMVATVKSSLGRPRVICVGLAFCL